MRMRTNEAASTAIAASLPAGCQRVGAANAPNRRPQCGSCRRRRRRLARPSPSRRPCPPARSANSPRFDASLPQLIDGASRRPAIWSRPLPRRRRLDARSGASGDLRDDLAVAARPGRQAAVDYPGLVANGAFDALGETRRMARSGGRRARCAGRAGPCRATRWQSDYSGGSRSRGSARSRASSRSCRREPGKATRARADRRRHAAGMPRRLGRQIVPIEVEVEIEVASRA